MYDNAGVVLRVETVINQPREFRMRRRGRRRGRRVTEWVPLRKSVAHLFRYRELALQSNNPVARADGQLFAALMSASTPCTALRTAISAPSLRAPRFRSTTMPHARVPRRRGSSTVCTCTGSPMAGHRFRPPRHGRFGETSGNSISPPVMQRPREKGARDHFSAKNREPTKTESTR
jgi:hypothetical protein